MISSDKGDTSAVVTWEVPSASDNQDATSPSVIQTAGSILPGTRVESGVVYTVKYVAFDSAGNPSEECSFNVQVKSESFVHNLLFKCCINARFLPRFLLT
jgi:hypothetical protein